MFILPPTVGPRVSATKAFGVQRGCSSISTNLCELRSRLGLFAARVLRGGPGGCLGLLSLGD